MQLFYHPEINRTSNSLFFEKEESRHIVKVLRKKAGDTLMVTNGKGSFFEVIISDANIHRCTINTIVEEKQPPLPYSLHLAVAPTKMNDRYEWFLEKATEIGITEITPVLCEHSERTRINNVRFEKIIQSAMKQSLKAYLPVIHPTVSLEQFVKNHSYNKTGKFMAHCYKSVKKPLFAAVQNQAKIVILIGPEGDFSRREIALAEESGFVSVSLGKSRLRTETAAVVACHTVNLALNGQ